MVSENLKVVPESALRFELNFESDIEIIEALVTLYCQRRVFRKEISRLPRAKLINMLSMYLRYGYNMETKNKLKDIFGEDDMTNINSWNRELRVMGFLIKDMRNENMSYLNNDLQQIKTYYDIAKGKLDIKIMFTLKDGGYSV